MIYVDVVVPVLGETFEFCCDAQVVIEKIISGICKILQKKMDENERAEKASFWLCSVEQERILNPSESLGASGIRNGDRLILL